MVTHLVMSLNPENQKPAYENTGLASSFLLSDAPFSLHGYIQHCNATVWPLFSHLESAVREGTHQHERAFGRKSEDMFQVTVCKFRRVCTGFRPLTVSSAVLTGYSLQQQRGQT